MKRILLLSIFLMLTSCASLQYGHFAPQNPAYETVILQDISNALPKAFSPAPTLLYVNTSFNNPFGKQLIHHLRQKGYAIKEHASKQNVNFYYVLDAPKKESFYRITLWIGEVSLSKVYFIEHEKLESTGFWVRKVL